jgi:hypothetical protein
MNFEKYTEKSRQLVEEAQALALRSSHQRLMPEHVLAAMMNERERLSEREAYRRRRRQRPAGDRARAGGA